MSTLGLVDGPHLALELDRGPGVAAGQGGPGDLGEVPGDTARQLGRQADGALQQAVAEGVFFKNFKISFSRIETVSLFWDNVFYCWIRAKYKSNILIH